MSATHVSTSDAVHTILGQTGHVLICDTCALLDIIRLPVRQKSSTRTRSLLTAASSISDMAGGSGVHLLLPPPVPEEWRDHAERVTSDTEKWAKDLADRYAVMEVVTNHFGNGLPSLDFQPGTLARHLHDLGSQLVTNGIATPKADDPALRANDRAAAYIPPASKGAIKDCIVYEHMLDLVARLREKGYSGRCVFLTSNIRDFCDDRGNPKSPLDAELGRLSVTLCTSWDWARSELGPTSASIGSCSQ
jgi:hypothetical protein